jgi:hypothetical protein
VDVTGFADGQFGLEKCAFFLFLDGGTFGGVEKRSSPFLILSFLGVAMPVIS